MLSASAFYIYLRKNSGNLPRISPWFLPALARCTLGNSSIISDDYRDDWLSTCHRRRHYTSSKPPNVLIYTGITSEVNEQRFIQIQNSLSCCLRRDKYLLYRITDEQLKTEPWKDNIALLVLACQNIEPGVSQLVEDFVADGGTLVSLCSSFVLNGVRQTKFCDFEILGLVTPELSDESKELQMLIGKNIFQVSKSDPKVKVLARSGDFPVLVHVSHGKGQALLSQVHLEAIIDEIMDTQIFMELKKAAPSRLQLMTQVIEYLGFKTSREEAPQLTPAYLLANEKDHGRLMQCLSSILDRENMCKGKDIDIKFVQSGSPVPTATESLFPVVIAETQERQALTDIGFDWQKYQEYLETKILGRMMIHTNVITSTQTILDGNYKFVHNLPSDLGIIVTARQQVTGKGRGGNMWISPLGCMMLSVHVQVGLDTELGSRLPFLQHIASLAAVQAVRTLPGYEDINLRLKWPNDIYFGKDIKIGGVIVNSSVTAGMFNAVIGMGINLDNSDPTLCINDLIKQYNGEHGTDLEPLKTEFLLAQTLNNLEKLIEDFQSRGAESFLPLYYNRWLHSDVNVRLGGEQGEQVTIVGLDESGFLSVQTLSGEIVSVQPDGNSFDMMKNLITFRR